MKVHKNLRFLTMKSLAGLSVALVLCLNFRHFELRFQNGALWYYVVLAVLLIGLYGASLIEKDAYKKSSLKTAVLMVGFIGSWIMLGVVNGFNSFSFHILHTMMVLLSYSWKKPSLGNWMFSIGNMIALLAFQLSDINVYSILLYMLVTLGAFIHLAHVRTVMKSKQSLQKKVDELETLYAITKVLDSFPDLDSVLQQITRIVTYGIGVDVCAFMLYSQETGELELQARYPDNISKYTLNPEVGLAGEVFRTGKPIVCGDLNENMELLERIRYNNEENALGIFPLEHHENRFGVLLFTKKSSMEIDTGIMQVMSAVASTVSMVISSAMHHENVARSAQLDGLTGLYNRSYFYDALEHEVRKARFTGQSVYVLVLDIDKFKLVNDTYGHLTGDRILEVIGQIISENTRKSDVAVRYGGEEFALILPNSCYTAAEHLAERIRRAVEKITTESNEFSGFEHKVTLSVGIACYPHCATDPKRIVDMADKRMYAAKRTGGNQYIYE